MRLSPDGHGPSVVALLMQAVDFTLARPPSGTWTCGVRSWYRKAGHDDARRVLLLKQRQRVELCPRPRVCGGTCPT
ncbi:hypothetical protein ABZ079_27275 [Streptomyces sp. NPDC006314]|uniref:hypothetical protein n=1 Tax=Streptomyces sp. NPDC006314 TaxID=3154475 RepID=UPI00339DFA7C